MIYDSLKEKGLSWKPLQDRIGVYARHLLPFYQTERGPILSHRQEKESLVQVDPGMEREMTLQKDDTISIYSNQWLGCNLRLFYRIRDLPHQTFEYVASAIDGIHVKVLPGPLISNRRSHVTVLEIDGSLIAWISLGRRVNGKSGAKMVNTSITQRLGQFEYCTGYVNSWNRVPLYDALPASMAFAYMSKGGIQAFSDVKVGELLHINNAKNHFITRITLPSLKSSIFGSSLLHFRFDSTHPDKYVTIETSSGALGEVKYFVNPIVTDSKIFHSFHGDHLLYPMDISSRPNGGGGVNITMYHPVGISFTFQASPDYLAIPMQLLKRFAIVPLAVSFSMYVAAISKVMSTTKRHHHLNSPFKAILAVVFDYKYHVIVLIIPCWWYGIAYFYMYLISFGFLFLNTGIWLFLFLKPLCYLFGSSKEPSESSMRKSIFFWSIVVVLTPHQYSFVFCFVFHLITCIRNNSPHNNNNNSVSYFHLWLLVYTIPLYMNAAGLMVWIKNILINHFTFEGQDLVPSIILVAHVMYLRKRSQKNNVVPAFPSPFIWLVVVVLR